MTTPLPIAENLPDTHAASGTQTLGWWGMSLLILHEIVLFVALLSSYLYLRMNAVEWPVDSIPPPELVLAGIATAVLVGSSVVAYFAQRSAQQGHIGRAALLLLGTLLLGAAFLGWQTYELMNQPFVPQQNAYSSLFYTIIGIHGLHMLVGLLLSAFIAVWIGVGFIREQRTGSLQNALLYWHFITVVWLFIFATLYLSVAL